MRPLIAGLAKFTHEVTVRVRKLLLEDVLPSIAYQLEDRRGVPLSDVIAQVSAVDEVALGRLQRIVRENALHLGSRIGRQDGVQEFQRLADAIIVGNCHGFKSYASSSNSPGRAVGAGACLIG